MTNEPQSGQRFDLTASLEQMEVNPEGEFALASDLDDALDLLARALDVINQHAETVLTADINEVLDRHRRHP